MRSIVIASLFAIVALTGTAAQAEIMCTQHGGCLETGMISAPDRGWEEQ